jgi:hypothetical protein
VTRDAHTDPNGLPSIDWAAVVAEYGERPALHALDAVMHRHRDSGSPLDWDATKAAALDILRGDIAPGSSWRAGLRDMDS